MPLFVAPALHPLGPARLPRVLAVPAHMAAGEAPRQQIRCAGALPGRGGGQVARRRPQKRKGAAA
ncbi:hypothetical protein [Pseudorhodoferax sp.]|uniref:hypothetical protein n=1 Tax=Pseudorhodoferax sp. TaxID=1993553 RepID=UPI0039E575CE